MTPEDSDAKPTDLTTTTTVKTTYLLPEGGISINLRSLNGHSLGDLVPTVSTFARVAGIIFFTLVLVNESPFGRDDTDQPGWFGQRSGLKVVVDSKTGCHYLVGPSGTATYRMDRNGRQVCE